MEEKQLDRIERKLNFLLVKLGGMETFGKEYRGWNGLSAYEAIMRKDPNYLKP